MRRSIRRTLLATLCAVAAVWVAGCALVYSEMRQPPEQFARFMTRVPASVVFLAFPFETLWIHARAGAVQVGDIAPDFSLETVDHSRQVRLSALNQGKPVVLLFGSYT